MYSKCHGEENWTQNFLDVVMTSLGKEVQFVTFEPKVSDDYSHSVCYKGQHIQGSPFTIKAMEKEALGDIGVLNHRQ